MKTRAINNQYGTSGFTLLEMSIVVAIMGLFAAIAVPNIIAQLPTRRLNQVVWELNAMIRLARTQAMSTGYRTEITYDQSSNAFQIWTDEDGDGLRDVNEVETIAVAVDKGLRVYAYPYNSVGMFSSDGSFDVEPSYAIERMFFYIEAKGSDLHYYMNIWPTGQVTVNKVVYQHGYS